MDSKLPNVGTTIFSVMSKMAQDYDAINLSQGFPNFKSDPQLMELVSRAMRDGYNQYAPMAGDAELRDRIAQKTNRANGSDFSADHVTVTAGATQAIFTAIAAMVHPGDEVIIFGPAYDCYRPAVELFGGVVVPVQLIPPNFEYDWELIRSVVTVKTKLIIINTPHNPSGTILTGNDLTQLQDLALANDLFVISDEVYEHIIFDGNVHQSVAGYPQLAERSFVIGSFGKTFHNTGWKVGYCMAADQLTREFQKVHQYNVFSVNHPVQKALANYLENPDNYENLGDFYAKKRDFLLSRIGDSRFKFTPSLGTYFQLLDFSEISLESDTDFTTRLTKQYGLATIPTSVFNHGRADYHYIRVCFAKTEETLEAAAEILNSIAS